MLTETPPPDRVGRFVISRAGEGYRKCELEDGDAFWSVSAIGHINDARGKSEIACHAGKCREAVYASFGQDDSMTVRAMFRATVILDRFDVKSHDTALDKSYEDS